MDAETRKDIYLMLTALSYKLQEIAENTHDTATADSLSGLVEAIDESTDQLLLLM